MFIQIGDRLKNIADFSEITKGDDGTAVLIKKGGVTQILNTSIDFDDLVKQMAEGHMLITPERKQRPQMAKAHPAPAKKPEGKKPDAPKAIVKPTETKPAKPAETPKTDVGKKPEAEKPKVVEAKKPEAPAAPKETPAASVNENEPDYIGKVHDRGNDENGNGGGK
ncbi:hypothetical protein [Rhizobium phage RHEph12]|nr:hypothetical protein [Rhizobium phage RHEph12]